METTTTFDRITARPGQMGGTLCIRGLRIPVATLVGMVAQGMTTEQILDEYPDLQPEDIQQALRYAAVVVDNCQPPNVDGA